MSKFSRPTQLKDRATYQEVLKSLDTLQTARRALDEILLDLKNAPRKLPPLVEMEKRLKSTSPMLDLKIARLAAIIADNKAEYGDEASDNLTMVMTTPETIENIAMQTLLNYQKKTGGNAKISNRAFDDAFSEAIEDIEAENEQGEKCSFCSEHHDEGNNELFDMIQHLLN